MAVTVVSIYPGGDTLIGTTTGVIEERKLLFTTCSLTSGRTLNTIQPWKDWIDLNTAADACRVPMQCIRSSA